MKKLAKICMALTSFAAAACMAISCSADAVEPVLNMFGQFSYGVHVLTEIAKDTITAGQAKSFVKQNQQKLIASVKSGINTSADETAVDGETAVADETENADSDGIKPCDEMIKALQSKYGGVNVTTKYYVEDSDDQQVKTDEVRGDDFVSLVTDNRFTPFNQLTARHLYVYEELIDFMNAENDKFDSNGAPFKAPFTYHIDGNNNFIIQTHYFTGISSSVSGGISCYYQQDTEILYDAQNKISRWQSSLGVILSTPQGTVHQGYILEMEFNWVEKI